MLRDLLRAEGMMMGRQAMASLMRRMGIEALYRRHNTSGPAHGHRIYPYSAAWPGDGSAESGLGDGPHRHPDGAGFCLDAVEEVLAFYGKPKICRMDQGSRLTGAACTGLPQRHGLAISMIGGGAWRDHVIVERLWRSVENEEVHLRVDDSV